MCAAGAAEVWQLNSRSRRESRHAATTWPGSTVGRGDSQELRIDSSLHLGSLAVDLDYKTEALRKSMIINGNKRIMLIAVFGRIMVSLPGEMKARVAVRRFCSRLPGDLAATFLVPVRRLIS